VVGAGSDSHRYGDRAVNVTNGSGATPLLLACGLSSPHLPLVRFLLEAGADVHIGTREPTHSMPDSARPSCW
jgi:hypothetical protein